VLPCRGVIDRVHGWVADTSVTLLSRRLPPALAGNVRHQELPSPPPRQRRAVTLVRSDAIQPLPDGRGTEGIAKRRHAVRLLDTRTAQSDFRRRVHGRSPLARWSARTRHWSRSFAAAIQLPTLLRSPMLAHGGARQNRSRERIYFPERETPRVARRLLQPNRSTSMTVDDPNPAHRHGGLPPSQLFSRVATAEQRD